jgi:nucleoid-associated protein YgaU
LIDRGVKVLLAVGVLAGGFALATLFRRPSSQPGQPKAGTDDRLVLREPSRDQVAGPAHGDPPTARIEASAAESHPLGLGGRSPARLPRIDSAQPPPRVARSYPDSDRHTTLPRRSSTGCTSPGSRPSNPAPRTHKIVDGDTLEALARRYLGDASRWTEIYEANRHVLPSPDLLPIGAELKLPPPSGAHRGGN